MSGWGFTEVGVSVTEEDEKLKKMLMDCVGLREVNSLNEIKDLDDFSSYRSGAAGYEYDSYNLPKEKKWFGESTPTIVKSPIVLQIFSIFLTLSFQIHIYSAIIIEAPV